MSVFANYLGLLPATLKLEKVDKLGNINQMRKRWSQA